MTDAALVELEQRTAAVVAAALVDDYEALAVLVGEGLPRDVLHLIRGLADLAGGVLAGHFDSEDQALDFVRGWQARLVGELAEVE